MEFLPFLTLGILAIVALTCLFLIAKSFRSRNFPLTYPKNIYQPLMVGGLSSGFGLSLIIAFGVSLWIQTGKLKSIFGAAPLLCILPFLFIITTLGSYLQIFYINKISDIRGNLVDRAIQEKKHPTN